MRMLQSIQKIANKVIIYLLIVQYNTKHSFVAFNYKYLIDIKSFKFIYMHRAFCFLEDK